MVLLCYITLFIQHNINVLKSLHEYYMYQTAVAFIYSVVCFQEKKCYFKCMQHIHFNQLWIEKSMPLAKYGTVLVLRLF